jgi:hypothetical protein
VLALVALAVEVPVLVEPEVAAADDELVVSGVGHRPWNTVLFDEQSDSFLVATTVSQLAL